MRGHHVKNKRDANESDIFRILRNAGIKVQPLDTPCDAVCGYGGHNYLVEVKNGHKATITKPQEKFIQEWKGQIVILRDQQEAADWATGVIKSAPHQFRGTIS